MKREVLERGDAAVGGVVRKVKDSCFAVRLDKVCVELRLLLFPAHAN